MVGEESGSNRVYLREITAETVRQIAGLAVRSDQQRFVASNAISLAEALFAEEAWYRARIIVPGRQDYPTGL